MQIVREIAGYSLAKADIVRRAMGKKDEKLMKEQEKEFTRNDMIEFAMWFSDKNCNYGDLKRYVTLNSSKLNSQAKRK
jgi:hypothetical protein